MKKILGSLLIFLLTLSANVSLKTDKLALYPGDTLNITITASGKDIKFPDIDNIAGFDIVGIANGSSTTIINGNITNSQTKTYTITPNHSFTIPKLKVIVDGKAEFTKEKKITLLNPSQTPTSTKGGDYELLLKADKTHLKVGESTTVKVIFKRKVTAPASKLYLDDFKNSNFWIKKVGSENEYVDGEWDVVEQTYLLFAQKSGEFTINPLKANVGILVQEKMPNSFNDPFFNSFFKTMRYKKVFSNALKIKVDPLPNGLEVYGDFKIFATVDKKEADANKPVNLTIKILGEGNSEDIKKFSISIPDAVVYSDEPKVKSYLKEGNYYGEFSQKVAIIADKDYTIPAITFTYFNKYQKKPVTIKTNPIHIKVKASSKSTLKDTPKIETSSKSTPIVKQETKVVYKENSFKSFVFYILGVLSGAVLSLLFFKQKGKKLQKKEKPLEKKILKAKSDKELYDLLLPFASHDNFKPILEKLEENLYKNSKHKIDKNEILDILESTNE